MLGTLLRKELLAHVLTLRFAVGAVFTLVLFVASALVLTADFAARVEAYQTAAATHREALAEARVFADLEVESDRPPAPLSVLVQGVDRSLPSSSAYSLISAPTSGGAGAARNPLLVVFPSLDLAIVVQMVMSLLALLFAYDAVSGERARGTLALTLASGAPRSTLLVGKYLGGMAALLPLLAVGMGLSLLVVAASPLVDLGAAEWIAAAMIFVASALYLSLVFLLGLLISTLTRRPGTSLIAALFAWVVLVLLVPPAATAAASALRPLPSQNERASAEQQAANEAWQELHGYAANHPCPLAVPEQRFNVERHSIYSGGVPMLARLYSAPREYMDWALAGVRFGLPVVMASAERVETLRQEATRSMAAQASLARALRVLSPASAYYDAATRLAGTHEQRYLSFVDSVARHRRAIVEFARANGGLDHRFFTRDAALGGPSLAELEQMEAAGEGTRLEMLLGTGFSEAPPLDLSGLPVLDDPQPGTWARLADATASLAVLIVVSLLLLAAAALRFARADVRVG